MDARPNLTTDARPEARTGPSTRPLALCVRGERVDLVVQPGATVGQLADRLGLDARRAVVVDGRLLEPATPVADAGLHHGSAIDDHVDGEEHDRRAADAPAVRLSVVGGIAAGRSWSLPPGEVVVGSARGADVSIAVPGLARHHALARITTTGSIEWVDLTDTAAVPTTEAGISRVGPLLVRTIAPPTTRCPPAPLRPPPGRWTEPWCRPVTAPSPPPVPPVRAPAPTEAPPAPGPVGWTAFVTPLLVGVVAMLVLGQPLLLLLGGAAAVASLVPRLVQFARAGRATRRSRAAADRELRRFAADLDRHRRAVVERLWDGVFDVSVALTVCAAPDERLWSRRRSSADAFTVTLGVGTGTCRPVVEPAVSPPGDDPALWALVEAASDLHDVPVPLALANGAVVGLAGDRTAARSVAAALITQLSTLHGPADLLLVAAADEASTDWDWMSWLPHCADVTGAALVATGMHRDALADAVRAAAGRRHVVLVVDGTTLLSARASGLRELLDGALGSVAAVVIGTHASSLPARCTCVVEVRADGAATVRTVATTGVPERLTVAGVAMDDAARAARDLARFEDPEVVDADGDDLPATVGLLGVLPPEVLDTAALAESWRAAGTDPPPVSILGTGAAGPVEVDLRRDGPHVLVAGTTGSGKSELLRSLVVGLAARQSPEQLTFVLVDYKGGSAFDACRELPHVVGIVTDLDAGLADRVLRSLGAELARREQLLRAAGASDLAAYRRLPGHHALSRLVVVVDEFATLAAEHPTFLRALVSVAQRGRSLGLHLVLATQRPAGVVNDDIRANTNLRLALRVQDPADSAEVLGDPVAATLPRSRPGRAMARFGLGELLEFQVATGGLPLPENDPPPIAVAGPRPPAAMADQPTTLEVVVRAIRRAADALGCPSPARPWTDPLPDILPASSLAAGAIALVDDPDHQRQLPLSWDRTAGHLVVVGGVGSGTTSALVTAALAATTTTPPDALHLYAVDHGAGELAALARLPHAGAVIGAAERERQLRLLHRLDAELSARQSGCERSSPEIALVVEDLVGWRRALDDAGEHVAVTMLDRILAAGPRAGVVVAASAVGEAGLPRALDGTVASCLTLGRRRARDSLGATTSPADAVPGRGVEVRSGLDVQVVHHCPIDGAVAAVARRWPGSRRRPAVVGTLPEQVKLDALPAVGGSGPPWCVPLGIDDATLEPAAVHLHRGDHLLVSGPARSGRTSVLHVVAHQLRLARPEGHVVALGFRDPDTAPAAPAGAAESTLDLVGHDPRDLVLLIDDAELVDDPDGVLAALVGGRDAIVVAAGRADALRSLYGHWTAALRRQRRGIVLCPTADVDGDVLGVVLPRQRERHQPPGRGFLVDGGDVRRVQVACATPVAALGPAGSG